MYMRYAHIILLYLYMTCICISKECVGIWVQTNARNPNCPRCQSI